MTQKVAFWILAFSIDFVLLEVTYLVTLFNCFIKIRQN